MRSSAALELDSVWLRPSNYEVVALNAKLIPHVDELARALSQGLPAYPDSSRENFYDLELGNGWFYVHIHDEAQTVYLVAYSRN